MLLIVEQLPIVKMPTDSPKTLVQRKGVYHFAILYSDELALSTLERNNRFIIFIVIGKIRGIKEIEMDGACEHDSFLVARCVRIEKSDQWKF